MTTTPTIRNNTNLTFAAMLKKPNDSVSFTFNVVNSGSLNAQLQLPNLAFGEGYASAGDPIVFDDITYKLTYADSTELYYGDRLNAGQTVTMKLTISYDNVASISATDKVLTATAALTYVQV